MKKLREDTGIAQELAEALGVDTATEMGDGLYEVDGDTYKVMTEDEAFQAEKELLEDLLSSSEEAEAFFKRNGFYEDFVENTFTYDFAMDINSYPDDETGEELNVQTFDEVVDYLDSIEPGSAIAYACAKPDAYLDFDGITKYVVESDDYVLLSPIDGEVIRFGDYIAVRYE